MPMEHNADKNSMDRRTFLKFGSLGMAAAAAGRRETPNGERPADPPAEKGAPARRTLGRTKLKVAVVGIGALRTTESAVIRAAFDRGVNYVDTARSYTGGNNERLVGKALKGYRDKVYVATKVSMVTPKEAIIRSLEESLSAMQTDYVDVLLLHGPPRTALGHEDARTALTQLREQGKVRFVGVSAHSDEVGVLNTIVDDVDKFYDMVLVTYNFKSGQDVKDAIARAARAGIGIVAMKTQAGGYKTEELGDISPHQAALKWVLQNPHVCAAVPGMADLAQVNEDTEILRMAKLSQVDRQILQRYGEAIKPYYCHRCGACAATCPKSVDIPTVNRCLMYAEGYRDLELARSTYAEVPVVMSASACNDCAGCVAQCANGLDIAAKMRRAHALLA